MREETPKEIIDFVEVAAKKLKLLMLSRDVSYSQLVERLLSVGVIETETSVSQKIRRGTFQFSFFLACITALELNEVTLVSPHAVENRVRI
jgi:hypothetical protein